MQLQRSQARLVACQAGIVVTAVLGPQLGGDEVGGGLRAPLRKYRRALVSLTRKATAGPRGEGCAKASLPPQRASAHLSLGRDLEEGEECQAVASKHEWPGDIMRRRIIVPPTAHGSPHIPWVKEPGR